MLAPLLSALTALTAAAALSVSIDHFVSSDDTSPITVYYARNALPLVLSPNISGLHAFNLPDLTPGRIFRPGDPRAVTVAYGKTDLLVTLQTEDSLLHVTNLKNDQTALAQLKLWGDYSTLCAVGTSWVYVFGKKQAKVVSLDGNKVTEVREFKVPIEAEACGSTTNGTLFFGGKNGVVYSLSGNSITPESTIHPFTVVDDEEIVGIAVYEGVSAPYLLVALDSGAVKVFPISAPEERLSLSFSENDIKLEGIAVYQNPLPGYPDGSLILSFDIDSGPKGIGIASLSSLSLPANPAFNPRSASSNPTTSSRCSHNGFSTQYNTCVCLTGYSGSRCAQRTCPNSCSEKGKCVAPNVCRCKDGWTGPDCSFKVVRADIETSANGGDGDDPAIWINPTNRSESRVVTTTKSKEGAGFALFDLKGALVSRIDAGEPNNVDIIYNFARSDGRVVDLAVAGCRADNSICIAEVTETALSSLVSLPIKPKLKVYGSCVYHSRLTGIHYIFVNSKDAEYRQYALTPSLDITLVRTFQGGSGGQTEGCVGDDENGLVYIGEEPYGLWSYGAEPDAGNAHSLIDSIDGNLFPDVEGVTLVNGPTPDKGLIIVSCQGVSAYNVYRRGGNHEFVGRFTIAAGKVDKVTNTDGVAAVGTNLGKGFERGLVAVHDDVNSSPDGSRETGASFKLVGLEEILREFNILDEADVDWDPRRI